jgi:hypothetical protein
LGSIQARNTDAGSTLERVDHDHDHDHDHATPPGLQSFATEDHPGSPGAGADIVVG